jgi:hypothetical protein
MWMRIRPMILLLIKITKKRKNSKINSLNKKMMIIFLMMRNQLLKSIYINFYYSKERE